jgi:uncharacterized protein
MNSFEPHPLLRNPHAQTVASTYWPRQFPRLPTSTRREFETEPGTKILGECNWQPEPRQCPTLVMVHGLEGSSQSGYMQGLAERAFLGGWNAVRLNQRNCGGTEHLTPTLYHSGLSGDYRAVLQELVVRDALPGIFFLGYSMGGNLVMKMAGELGAAAPRELLGIACVSPSMDLAVCADAIARPVNILYQQFFVTRLKSRMRRKATLFPGKFDLEPLKGVRTIRDFDDVITARYCGFQDASDYYERSSALRVAADIRVPTFILTAQGDPFIPYASFANSALAANACVELIAPEHGGHCAFISRHKGDARFWAEARVMEFFRNLALESASIPIPSPL